MRILIALLMVLTSACSHAEDVRIGGQLRQNQEDPTQWCWIANGTHATRGVDNALCGTAEGDKITLPYGVTYSKVINFEGFPDDDYVSNLDMKIGSSKGLSYSIMRVTSFGQSIDVDVWLGYAYGNIEISGWMEK